MNAVVIGALYALGMAIVIVGVDLTLFRGQFWERLAANIGIAVLFAALYFGFFKRP